MTQTLQQRIEGLIELDKVRTQGQWGYSTSKCDDDELVSIDAVNRHISLATVELPEDMVNAKFIAAAPDMMQIIREQRALLIECKATLAIYSYAYYPEAKPYEVDGVECVYLNDVIECGSKWAERTLAELKKAGV